jgi:hypothetical protein
MRDHMSDTYRPRPVAIWGSDVQPHNARIVEAAYTERYMEVVVETDGTRNLLHYWLGSPVRVQPARDLLWDCGVKKPEELTDREVEVLFQGSQPVGLRLI